MEKLEQESRGPKPCFTDEQTAAWRGEWLTHHLTELLSGIQAPRGQYSVSCFPGHLAFRSKNCAGMGRLYPISLHPSLRHPEPSTSSSMKPSLLPIQGPASLCSPSTCGATLCLSWMPPRQEKGPIQPCLDPLCSGFALTGKSVQNYQGGQRGVRPIGLGLRFLSVSVHRLL